jgi:uncharacterized protein YndB with AHSA1/START domain
MSQELKVTTPSDREIMLTRVFDAPRRLVWEAYTRPELLKRWLLGPPGWTMVVCEVGLTVGSSYRYVWRNTHGTEMGMGGVVLEIVPPERMVCTEKFDDPWYKGEAVGTVLLVEQDGKTTLTQTIRYESKEVRDSVLRSPMERGVAASYDRLAELLASTLAGGSR